jgi:hypothetical protein
MRPIHIYLAVSKVCPKNCLVGVSYGKENTFLTLKTENYEKQYCMGNKIVTPRYIENSSKVNKGSKNSLYYIVVIKYYYSKLMMG